VTTSLEQIKDPRMNLEAQENGVRVMTFTPEIGLPIVCRYWKEPRPRNIPVHLSYDQWRYELPQIAGLGGVYSHPTETGCQIMIVGFLRDIGLLAPQEDNAHLDAKDRGILEGIKAARESYVGKPRVGDFVIMPDGTKRRCAHAWDDGMQTSGGGSFSVGRNGRASMSGSLYPSQLWEYFKDTGLVEPGRFWFFHHGISGAGRGVDVYLPCRVYRLCPFEMTEEQARAHPSAISAAEFWGEDHPEHLKRVRSLMHPEIR